MEKGGERIVCLCGVVMCVRCGGASVFIEGRRILKGRSPCSSRDRPSTGRFYHSYSSPKMMSAHSHAAFCHFAHKNKTKFLHRECANTGTSYQPFLLVSPFCYSSGNVDLRSHRFFDLNSIHDDNQLHLDA